MEELMNKILPDSLSGVISGLIVAFLVALGSILAKRRKGNQMIGKIVSPANNTHVGKDVEVKVKLEGISPGEDYPWIAVKIQGLFWPKASLPSRNDEFDETIHEEAATHFSISLLLANETGDNDIKNWLKRGEETGSYPGLTTTPYVKEIDVVSVRV